MKRLARLFSALNLLVLAAGVAVMLYDRSAPVAVPEMAPLTSQIDHILIEKSARRMTVFRAGDALKTYRVALGFTPSGDKVQEGDGRTPEGVFTLNRRNPQSAYHLSLGIDYPQADDVTRARNAGVSPGGDIFIHGQPNGLGRIGALPYDWTAGCIAVSDADIEELWRVAPNGTPVEIRP